MKKTTTVAVAGVAAIMAGAAACVDDSTTNNVYASCGPGTQLDPGTNACLPVDGGAGSGDASDDMNMEGDAGLEGEAGAANDSGADSDAAVSHDPADLPETVRVEAATVYLKYGGGYSRHLDTFLISKTPTTVGQYRRCVSAGACSIPKWDTHDCLGDNEADPMRSLMQTATWDDTGVNDGVPVTCASPEQMSRFCSWAGDGAVPGAEQWFLAARGPTDQTYPWGEDPPTCDQHPTANPSCCPAPCLDPEHFAVGQRPANASPSGVLDILMAWGELVAESDDSEDACNHAPGGCLATRDMDYPGSIADFLQELSLPDKPSTTGTPFSFRCVWRTTP